MNRVQQIRQWDWRTLLYPQYFCHIEVIVDGNRIEDERIPKTKVQIAQENKAHKMSKSANVSNIKLTEKCTKTIKIQVIIFKNARN